MERQQENHTNPQSAVKKVYEEIAGEYDRRIPGFTPTDKRFTDTEISFILSKVQPTDQVLDMGCGTGRFTIPLAQHAAAVTGLDLSPAMIAQARQKAEQAGVRVAFHESDMATMPFEDGTFDVVTSMLALMHIPLESRQQVFLEATRVLKPGGRMVIGVKNAIFERLSRTDRFASVDITDVDQKQLIFTQTERGEDLSAPWFSFSPADLQRLFATSGMTLVHLRGNTPIAAWLADNILQEASVLQTITHFETALGDVPPFNYLGYHLLAEAVKPIR